MSQTGHSRQMPAVRPIRSGRLCPESDAISSGKRNDATCHEPTCGLRPTVLLYQACLAQAFGELISIRGIFKRQSAKMV